MRVAAPSQSTRVTARTGVIAAAAPRPQNAPAPQNVAAAALAAAFLVASTPFSAEAKVVLAKGAAKKVFQGEPSALRDRSSSAASSSSKKKANKGPGFGSGATPSIGAGSIGTLALPLSVLGIAGAFAAASAADAGFSEFVDGAAIRDCNDYAGYEPVLKGESGPPTRAGAGGGGAKKALKKKK